MMRACMPEVLVDFGGEVAAKRTSPLPLLWISMYHQLPSSFYGYFIGGG
jgi:hypothetical protein